MITWPDLLWLPSPNHYRGRNGFPVELLVMHYTAGRGDERGTGRVFASPSRNASAHFGIGRSGGLAQYVALDDAAWHAGDGKAPTAEQLDEHGTVPLSMAREQINRRSVGIEICNRGWAPGGANPRVEARHRNPGCRSKSWESFSPEQYVSLRRLVAPLRERFPTMRYVLGHEDVTFQKTDPGPAFDWSELRGFGLTRVTYDFAAHDWRTEAL